jgi:hypothetical protein
MMFFCVSAREAPPLLISSSIFLHACASLALRVARGCDTCLYKCKHYQKPGAFLFNHAAQLRWPTRQPSYATMAMNVEASAAIENRRAALGW